MTEPEQTPQENVPFAIRDIAANEPAQTLPSHTTLSCDHTNIMCRCATMDVGQNE